MPDTESLAVSEVVSIVSFSDILKPEIVGNSTTPSFDGQVRIQPHGERKKALELVRVQVKGHFAESEEEFERETISFPADVEDLENYLRNGGVLFFCVVVYGTKKRAYYSSLLPVKLKGILKSASDQSTKNIELIPAPADVQELEELFINHSRESATQFSFWDKDLPEADLVNILPGISYSARYDAVAASEYEAAKHILGKDIYVYMELEGLPVPVSVPTNTTIKISSMGKLMEKPISVNGVRYFDGCMARITEQTRTVEMGNVTLSYPPEGEGGEAKFNIALTGTFRERLRSLRFAKAMVLNGGFEIGETKLELVSEEGIEKFSSGEYAQICQLYEDIATILEAFNDGADFEIGAITEDDLKAISMLKRGIIEGQRLKLIDIGYEKAVSGVHFLGRHYLLYRETGEDGLTSIRDYVSYETNVAMQIGKDTPMLQIAKYGFARPAEYLDVANLSAQALAEACITVGYNEANCNVANEIALALLGRYDEEGNTEDIDAAESIFEWLNDGANQERSLIYEVNLLQAQCRRDQLSQEAKARVREIIEEDASTAPSKRMRTAACWAILGDEKRADTAYRKLNKGLREHLKDYPIYNLICGKARRAPQS